MSRIVRSLNRAHRQCAFITVALASIGWSCTGLAVERTLHIRASDPNALPEAVMHARAEFAHHPNDDLRIELGDGVYPLDHTLELGLEDSPQEGHFLTIAAAPGAHPVISGGRPIHGWRLLADSDAPSDLPAAARGHVWVADLPLVKNGRWRFRSLYDGFTFLQRARSPQFMSRATHAKLAERLRGRDVLPYPAGSIRNWPDLADVEILARPNHDWVVNYLPIESVDETTAVAHMGLQATYTMSGRFWIENTLEYLDGPGKWVLNSQEGRLYLWPKGPTPGDAIVAPTLETLIRVAGAPDNDSDNDRPAHGFRFEGLTFCHTDRDLWTKMDASIQHDWEMWDKDDACLRFRVARDCSVSECVFRAAGDNGIRADLYAQHLTIKDNTFQDLGAGGVLCCGYGPGTKDVNHGNNISDNEFSSLGVLMWHSPAIFLWQSGENEVSHNYLHDLPYNGIVLDGVRPRYFGIPTPKIPEPTYPPDLREDMHTMRWLEIGWARTIEDTLRFAHTRDNRVEDNEICDVMKVLKDGNGIYLSAAGKGNLLRRNVLYRMNGSAAIRTDDDQSYVSITQNVVIGGGIVVKDYNFTWNNILYHAPLTIISDRPDSRVDHNVFIEPDSKSEFYVYDLVNSYFGNQKNDSMLGNFNKEAKPVVPPKSDHNLVWTEKGTADGFLREMRQRWGNDASSLAADPRLKAPLVGDFSFGDGSPAAQLGITSVDTSSVGLSKDPMVTRLARERISIIP